MIPASGRNNRGTSRLSPGFPADFIPGNPNTPSSYLLNELNQNSSLDNMAQAAQLGMQAALTNGDLQQLLNGCLPAQDVGDH
jgi:hypothetical protein